MAFCVCVCVRIWTWLCIISKGWTARGRQRKARCVCVCVCVCTVCVRIYVCVSVADDDVFLIPAGWECTHTHTHIPGLTCFVCVQTVFHVSIVSFNIWSNLWVLPAVSDVANIPGCCFCYRFIFWLLVCLPARLTVCLPFYWSVCPIISRNSSRCLGCDSSVVLFSLMLCSIFMKALNTAIKSI